MDKSETRTVYKVTGISRDYSEEQLKHMMIEENEDILQRFRDRFLLETKLVRRRKCKNREVCSSIVYDREKRCS